MKRSMLKLLSIAFVGWLCCVPAMAQETGRFDLAPIQAALAATPKVNLNFGPAMMSGFAETVRGQNAELAGIIESVRGLRLMVFEELDPASSRGQTDQLIGALGREGWTPALEVRDEDAHVDLYLIESDRFVEGMVLLVTEGEGTVVVANIYGNLEPALIGRLISQGGALKGLDLESLSEQFKSGDDEI